MTKFYLDTNVVVDHFLERHPFFIAAYALFRLCSKGKIQLFLSATAVTDIYYLVRRFKDSGFALAVIELLLKDVEVLPSTAMEVRVAIKSNFADFEDAVQHATALQVEGLTAIVTRNTKDFKKASVQVLTPVEALQLV